MSLPKAWLIFEDVYGLNVGPYVLTQVFSTQDEADQYMKVSKYPCQKAQHDYRSKKHLYPQYYNELPK